MVLAREKKEVRCMYIRERSELREDRAYDYGANSGSPLGMPMVLIKNEIHTPLELYIT